MRKARSAANEVALLAYIGYVVNLYMPAPSVKEELTAFRWRMTE